MKTIYSIYSTPAVWDGFVRFSDDDESEGEGEDPDDEEEDDGSDS